MKKITIILGLAMIVLLSCGPKEQEENYSFSFDFDSQVNKTTIMNMHTVKFEEGNAFSTIQGNVNYGFGIGFKGSDILSSDLTPNIQAKVRKDSNQLNSATCLVINCLNNKELFYWNAIKIDSNVVPRGNEWFDFYIDDLQLPNEIVDSTEIGIYFWSVDGGRLDIDDFKINF